MDVSEYTKDDIPKLRNIPVLSSDGDELGHVGDAYYDEDTGRLECVAIKGDALGFTKRVIPVAGARLDGEGLHLPFGRTDLEGGPDFGGDDSDEFDADRYGQVSDYYGSRGTVGPVADGLPGADLTGPNLGEAGTNRALDRDAESSEQAGSRRLRRWTESNQAEDRV